MRRKAKGKIVVVGSANADLMIGVSNLPGRGETMRGRDFIIAPGGKGANQAVAAARLGGDVSFVGCIGDDAFGQSVLAALAGSGVDTEHVTVAKHTSTGVALILTEDGGENCIAIAAGANDLLLPDRIDSARREICNASLVVCQLESPITAVEHAISIARDSGVAVLLNPAPAAPITDAMLSGIDFLVPNHHELAGLTGMPVNGPDEIEAAANSLLRRGVRTVIVTLGGDGVLRADASGSKFLAAPNVDVVDTTGAGDTFVGGFAAAWCRTSDIDAAIEFAQTAAAYGVPSRGAQASMPSLSDLDEAF
jgi:ribokinase